jgi:membrane-associated phospholipid phosphatase
MAVAVCGNWHLVNSRISRLDEALYVRLARTDLPPFDRGVLVLSRSADHAVLWLLIAGLMAAGRNARATRSAAQGLVVVAATSLVANQVAKRSAFRARPDRTLVPEKRRAPSKSTSSFPSGHSASAIAFALVAGRRLPVLTVPLLALAMAVGVSRVLTGMHYPSDVVAGAGMGALSGLIGRRVFRRWDS